MDDISGHWFIETGHGNYPCRLEKVKHFGADMLMCSVPRVLYSEVPGAEPLDEESGAGGFIFFLAPAELKRSVPISESLCKRLIAFRRPRALSTIPCEEMEE